MYLNGSRSGIWITFYTMAHGTPQSIRLSSKGNASLSGRSMKDHASHTTLPSLRDFPPSLQKGTHHPIFHLPTFIHPLNCHFLNKGSCTRQDYHHHTPPFVTTFLFGPIGQIWPPRILIYCVCVCVCVFLSTYMIKLPGCLAIQKGGIY